jgi:formate-dependent nitrite reductase cytochrome c552 subunit
MRIVALLFVVIVAGSAGFALSGRTGKTPRQMIRPAQTRPSTPHNVAIRTPHGPPMLETGLKDLHGRPVMASCVSCHATRPANVENRAAADLDEFHQGLTVKHGSLSCVSCHNGNDYNTLRLADGKRVEFTDVMTLCAQCHGPQFRDYQHGAHGGMNGYWDLGRGGRTRNNCVDCHDPHAPAYQSVRPAAGPRDRFLTPSHPDHSSGEHKQ